MSLLSVLPPAGDDVVVHGPDRDWSATELRARVDEIAATDGIDVLWIGHFDLSNSLGIPVQFTHPQFQDAVQRVLAACKQHGKAAGFMCSDVASGQALLAQGFRILAYSGDLWLYQNALREGLSALRSFNP